MKAKRFFIILAAAIAGEIALVLFTTLAQEVLVDGVHWGVSSTSDLILGGVATFIAGILAGMVASTIGGKDNHWPHVVISVFITAEMIYLITAEKINNPLWFAIVSGLALILSIWVGFYLYRRIKNG